MLAMAASVLLTCSLAWNVAELRSRAPEKEVLAQNILSSHLTSLLGTHLLDVVSSDQHTVKPWFNGKLDFSPEVKDLATDGFPLAGGRIEYLSGRTVAALVYQRRKHIINVFTWPSTRSDAKESHFSRNGYNELEWSNGFMTYWAVSDVPETDLQQLKSLLVK
jgi:anti-sigma factor RsiW